MGLFDNYGDLDSYSGILDSIFLSNDEVTLMRKTTTRSASGDLINSWADIMTYRARVEVIGSTEAVAAGYDTNYNIYAVTVPREAQVSMMDRIKWNDKEMEVVEVQGGDTSLMLLELVCQTIKE